MRLTRLSLANPAAVAIVAAVALPVVRGAERLSPDQPVVTDPATQ